MKLKKLFFIALLFLYSTVSIAQYKITIKASILDYNTEKPLEYVNVEFIGKNIKAITNEKGEFILQYVENMIDSEDRFQCAILGYETISVKSYELFKLLKNTNKIFLKPKKQISDKGKGNIFGKITSEYGPIQGAIIQIKNTFNETTSDSEGNYRINAKVDDVLRVSYLGMINKEILVSDNDNINIKLKGDGELLDEVLLEGNLRSEEQIIETSFGQKREGSVGYSVNTIESKDISVAALSLADVIVGRFAGVRVAGLNVGYNSPKFIIRGGGGSITNPIPAIFVVDGMIYTEMPDFINVQQIENISILKSIVATNRYGTIGSGGAFVIKMKTQAKIKAKKGVPSLLVKGNNYQEELNLLDEIQNTPYYIKQLEKAPSFQKAKMIYNSQRDNNERLEIPYFVNVSNYFRKWDEVYAHGILMTISDIAYNNPKALKILAYQLEALGKVHDAKLIYQRLMVLRPKNAQSYRDLALIYEATANYEDAMKIYADMIGNKIEGVDFTGLTNTINNELKHLLAKHRNEIDYSRVDPEFLKAKFKYDLRIVFDYNDANTEFELQFINPKKKFYTWSHSLLENKNRLLDEVQNGYATEEYIIDDAKSGKWIINLECFTKESLENPTYLKYTVFKNYGLPNEIKVIKVIKLYQYQQKVTLEEFIY